MGGFFTSEKKEENRKSKSRDSDSSEPHEFSPIKLPVQESFTVEHDVPQDIVSYIMVTLRNIVDLKYQVTTIYPEHFNVANKHGIKSPYGVYVDYETGDIVFTEFHSHYVRKITRTGEFLVVTGTGSQGKEDGKPGTATIYSPAGLCLDANRDIVVTDFNNHLLRRISRHDNTLSTLDTGKYTLKMPSGICLDPVDNTLVFNDCHNHNVKRIELNGSITVLAGSPTGAYGYADGKGTEAQFRHPAGICTDGHGNFYLTDHWNHCIRKITREGVVSTVAGIGPSGDQHNLAAGSADGWKEAAKFDCPQGIAYYKGHLFVADMSNHTIRKVSIEGEVTTIAGSPKVYGPLTTNGDGADARFYHPIGVFAERDGCILIADASNHGIRRLIPKWFEM